MSVAGLPHLKGLYGNAKRYFTGHPLVRRFRSSSIVKRYLTDFRFRAGVFLGINFFINLLYIVIKLISGIYYKSAWFISLAVYYILLALVRLMLLHRMNTRDETMELRRYRLCGIMLLLMNQALVGIVVFMVHQNRGFNYPGALIYAMAFYSFFAVIQATINVTKSRRHESPVFSAAKAIDFVAALVSLLSLTTAMLARFGGDDDPMFLQVITTSEGGVICVIIILIAIYMIVRANRELKWITRKT